MCPHAATHVSTYYSYGDKLEARYLSDAYSLLHDFFFFLLNFIFYYLGGEKLEAHYLSDAYQVLSLLALPVQKYKY